MKKAYFAATRGVVDTPVYHGLYLVYGNRIEGPAIIVEPTTTIAVPPGYAAKVTRTATSWCLRAGGAELAAVEPERFGAARAATPHGSSADRSASVGTYAIVRRTLCGGASGAWPQKVLRALSGLRHRRVLDSLPATHLQMKPAW